MNRIILIGSGFDMAHGLRTSYKDFIDDYWKQKSIDIKNCTKTEYEDSDLYLSRLGELGDLPINKDWNIVTCYEEFDKRTKYRYSIKYYEPFLSAISKESRLKGWVDIEEEYFKTLSNAENKIDFSTGSVRSVNGDFKIVQDKLIKYLRRILETNEVNRIEQINAIIRSNFRKKDLTLDGKKYLEKNKNDYSPSQILFLNFNYTHTEKLYVRANEDLIHIHGELDNPENPIIFGYGNEEGEEYKKIINLNNNYFLEYIKSVNYLRTNNYKRLIEFVDSDYYQIFIMGHSCGVSDRILLSMLFEHKNCVSIKPFYHYEKRVEEKDNYNEIVNNIYRNFKNKNIMRNKVVNRTYCEPLPQNDLIYNEYKNNKQ